MTYLEPLMRQNFLEYASYVVIDRAIPDIRDGCKPVQRRILHTLSTMDDGKFTKVANVIGECMKLHPHGDVSIGDALVVLANKGRALGNFDLSYFIEKQGNFGNLITGDGAAASRYIECRLTAMAKEVLFNPALTATLPSYDGRRQEPESLPTKVPVILMLGTEGIAVGMATSILSHNFGELLKAQVKILKGEKFKLLPDFATGGLMDASDYDDGRGKVKVRAKIEVDGEKCVVISEIPWTTTTESLMNSIETAVQKGKIKISEILDKTGEDVRIELHLARGIKAEEIIPQLYAYTDCEVSINSNIVVIRDRKPWEATVSEVLEDCTARLQLVIRAELEHELDGLTDKQHWLTLEQIFIENRVYKRIEDQTTEEGVRKAIWKGMEPFSAKFVRAMIEDDVDRLLDIRIKRISQYDIDKNRRDIDGILADLRACKAKLKDLVGTTINWIEDLYTRYAKIYPRRTKTKAIEEIDKKAIASANIRIGFDANTGFFGRSVKAADRELKVTEYDKILVIFEDGRFKIMAPPEKTVLEGKIRLLQVFNPDEGFTFTLIYRDKKKFPWAKRTTIKSFIHDKEYELIKDGDGRIEYLETPAGGTATCIFLPSARSRSTQSTFDLSTLEVGGVASRGTKIADKPVSKVTVKK